MTHENGYRLVITECRLLKKNIKFLILMLKVNRINSLSIREFQLLFLTRCFTGKILFTLDKDQKKQMMAKLFLQFQWMIRSFHQLLQKILESVRTVYLKTEINILVKLLE